MCDYPEHAWNQWQNTDSHTDNHKPRLSSDDAPSRARLKPSLPGKSDSYDLSFNDGDGTYAYAGSRNLDGNQYVLHFDPNRKAFILDRVDSTFNMNVTRVPGNSDPGKLSRQYPPLEAARKSAPKKTQAKDAQRKPAAKKKPPKDEALSLPQPEKAKPKPQQKRTNDVEEEEDDDDGGLLVEYPGGNNSRTDFSPAFPPPRRFDDFMDKRDSEADDADGESDDEIDMDFKLPSPVNHHVSTAAPPKAEEPPADDLEDDLAKEMEIAFEDLANSQEGSPNGDESEISEED